jgi:hypothetical protein
MIGGKGSIPEGQILSSVDGIWDAEFSTQGSLTMGNQARQEMAPAPDIYGHEMSQLNGECNSPSDSDTLTPPPSSPTFSEKVDTPKGLGSGVSQHCSANIASYSE